MIPAPQRPDEEACIDALRAMDILDSALEAPFQALVKTASIACGTPISLISLIDTERQWFKANIGLPEATETPREFAFCAHAVLGDEVFEVQNALEDERFFDNPLVAGAPDIRFYAGAPISLSSGARVGTVCVIDRVPRQLSDGQRETLSCLAEAAASLIEGRKAIRIAASQTEIALQASLVLEHSADPVIATNEQGRIERWNKAAENFFSLTAQDALGKNFEELVRPIHAPLDIEKYKLDKSVSYEAALRSANGSLLYAQITQVSHVETSSHGQETTYFIRDVSALTRARAAADEANLEVELRLAQVEQARQEASDQEMLLLALMDNLPQGVLVLDEHNNIVLGNAVYFDMLDIPMERFGKKHVTFKTLFDYTHQRGDYPGETLEESWARVKGMLDSRAPVNFERCQPSGKWLEIRGTPLDNGWALLSYDDISDYKNAERKTAESHALLLGAIDAADEAFVLFGPDDRLVYANEKYLQTYPASRDIAVPGALFEDIVRRGAELGQFSDCDPSDKNQREAWVAERMRKHRTPSAPAIQPLADGRFIRVIEARMPDGHTVGFRIDITDLTRARQAAEDASLAKSSFLANMSHEIRTPMNAIVGMLALIKKTALSEQQLDYVAKSENSAHALLSIINDILDFSKIEAGKLLLDPKHFSLSGLLDGLSPIVSAGVGAKPIDAIFDIDPRIDDDMVGDDMRLRQILLNLLGNAIKFTAKGTVRLSARLARSAPGQAFIDFEVSDTGIGIAEADQAKIFAGFSQAESSTTRQFGGTGLGLVISQRLARLMGSEISLISAPGQGSSFGFCVALGVQPTSKVQDARAECPRVLFLDDNPMAATAYANACSKLGWHAEIAKSLEEARQIVAGKPAFFGAFAACSMQGASKKTFAAALQNLIGPGARIFGMQRSMANISADDLPIPILTMPIHAKPLREAFERANAPMAPRNEPSKATARRLQGFRILLAEDNAINQQVAVELLSAEGALMSVADNGSIAADMAQKAKLPFDAILMDIQMPVMDGFQAMAEIKRRLLDSAPPIIAMTANAMSTDRAACLAAGMLDHVGKPFDLDVLVASLLRHIKPRRSRIATTSTPLPTSAPSSLPNASTHFETPIGSKAAATPSSNPQLFDPQSAIARLGGSANLYYNILGTFVRDMAGSPQDILAHATAGRIEEAKRAAHTLKGLASTVGAKPLSAAAGLVETACLANDAPALLPHTTELVAAMAQTLPLITSALANR